VTKPVLQALLLADRVYRDGGTGKHIICGVFSELFFKPPEDVEKEQKEPGQGQIIEIPIAFGHMAGSPWAYISLTELRGETRCELRYVDLQDNTTLFNMIFVVPSDDPLKTHEISLPLPSLPLPVNAPDGERQRSCALELLCNDELVGSHRVSVRPIESKGDK
jgi:hypothetical protein